MKRFLKTLAMVVVAGSFYPLGPSALHAQEQFQGDEVVVEKVTPKPEGNPRRALKLDLDETRIIFQESTSSNPNWYFYLPPEANSVVQLIIEKRDGERTFLLKAIGRGKTVGGFVLREWLDNSGFQPKTPLDEAQIQQAVKSKPVFIIVN